MPTGRNLKHGLLLLVALLGATCPSFAQKSPAFTGTSATLVTGLGRGTVLLDGAWQFHTGDNSAWAFPEANDSDWDQIQIGLPWGEQGFFAYSGFAWFRRHLTFGSSAAGYEVNPDEIALYIPKALCIYEVYWNGRLVSPPVTMPSSNAGQYSPTRALRLGPAEDGVLAIRVWTVPLDSSSSGEDRGFGVTPRLGNFEAVSQYQISEDGQNLKASLVDLAEILVYGLIALIGLLIWLRNRSQKLLKWMVLFFLASMIAIFANPAVFPWLSESPILFFSPVHSLEDISLWYLIIYLLDLDRNASLVRWTRVIAWISIVSAVVDNFFFLIPWSSYHVTAFQIIDAIFTFGFSAAAIYPLVLIPFALRKRPDTARLLVALAAFFSEMYDVVQHSAIQGQRFTHWTFGPAMLVPVFTIGGLPITIPSLLSTLLVCSIVYAVYRFTIEQGQTQTALQQEF